MMVFVVADASEDPYQYTNDCHAVCASLDAALRTIAELRAPWVAEGKERAAAQHDDWTAHPEKFEKWMLDTKRTPEEAERDWAASQRFNGADPEWRLTMEADRFCVWDEVRDTRVAWWIVPMEVVA